MRTTRIIGFSVPPTVIREVEQLAKKERRTKSELFREMVRVYQRYRDQRDRDEARWVMNLIEESRSEQAKNPMSEVEMLAEDDRLARYGAAQARKLGLKSKDVTRIIHEHRRARRTSGSSGH